MSSDEWFTFDRERLRRLASEHAASFRTAEPFPHIVIDDFVPERVIDEVLEEFPDPSGDGWRRYLDSRQKKLEATDDSAFGARTRHLLAQFNSATFVDFLERLTGIEGLVPDPWFEGGGLHQIQAGGYLKVHADFNKHAKLRLDRRLNAILYLNRDWDEAFGGKLQLWDPQMTRCVREVLPIANRLIIFSTTSTAFHGHPDPLTCPEDRTRRSMALYYYSNGRPEREDVGIEHTTRFRRRPDERFERRDAKEVAKALVPPLAVEGYQRARDHLRERRLRRRGV